MTITEDISQPERRPYISMLHYDSVAITKLPRVYLGRADNTGEIHPYEFRFTAPRRVRRGLLPALQENYPEGERLDSRRYEVGETGVSLQYQRVNPLFAIGMGFAPVMEDITVKIEPGYAADSLADTIRQYLHDRHVSFASSWGKE
ncbi:hypothetical protein HY495_02825 [Candidatus Woesearchaeota archaeon]|nr:hypothetical protein [Candidatus Woesearchaeota archaeon]